MSGASWRRLWACASAIPVVSVLVLSQASVGSTTAAALSIPPCLPIAGTVSDMYGNALSGATIAASDPNGYCGSSDTTQSGADGSFSVDIPPGMTSDSAM